MTFRCLRMYNRFRILLYISSDAQATATSILMLIGTLVCVCCNYITVKLHRVIQMPFLPFFPIVGIITPIIISATLPFTIKCNTMSEDLIDKWNKTCMLVSCKGLLKRKLRATRPLTFTAGFLNFNFFETNYFSFNVVDFKDFFEIPWSTICDQNNHIVTSHLGCSTAVFNLK